jgi:hypothetical protein
VQEDIWTIAPRILLVCHQQRTSRPAGTRWEELCSSCRPGRMARSQRIGVALVFDCSRDDLPKVLSPLWRADGGRTHCINTLGFCLH